MIGILCAMDRELELLLEKLERPVHSEICGYDYISGRISDREVVLARCGIGKVNAAVCAQTMIFNWKPTLILNSGVAGGLRGDFEIGDVCVAVDLVQHDVDTTALGDPAGFVSTVGQVYFRCADWAVEGLLKAAARLKGVRARRARIASGDQFITDAAAKAAIVERFGADACEMEGGAIAQVCLINGVDCAVLRCISDSSSGLHQMEYREFMPLAAKTSASVALEFLKNL